MLTKFDELTCHQTVETFDTVGTSDRAWTEKLWVNLHDTAGELVLATGLGVYPNRDVMDGYGCANVGNQLQTNVRASRQLRPRAEELAVGPLTYEVLEPYRRIRLAMGENPQGIEFDLEFVGKLEPHEEIPQFGRSAGRVYVHTQRYAQLGRAKGWAKVGDKRFDIEPERFYAQRDHSWGIRLGVGAPETGVQMTDVATFFGMMVNWLTLQFEDWGIQCYLIERADGSIDRLTGAMVFPLDAGKDPIPVTKVDHDYAYHDGAPRMQGGTVTFHLADGSKKTIEMQEKTTMYLRGGGYLGIDDYYHGLWMGEQWQTGEAWEVGDPKVADSVHGLNDTVVECTCDGSSGYGIVENLILPPFPKYDR